MADRRAVRAGSRQPPLLVFIHVPKTAGTTVRAVLAMNAPGNKNRMLPNVFKGGGGLDKSLMDRLRDGKGPLERSPRDLAGVRVLRGHVPLGIREHLPQHVAAGREIRYFTFLRDPVDRMLSHFFAIRDQREGVEEQGKYTLGALPKEPTLDDMLKRGYVHDNLHTRMLSGLPEPFGEVTDAMLERAKGNLRDGLDFFGITERFDESLVLAEQRLGLSPILYKAPSRVNTTRPRDSEVPEQFVRSAEHRNRYDIELYRYACELFESAPERGQLEFEIELAALRAAKGAGRMDLDAPTPDGLDGTDDVWRMLLHARATAMRLQLENARNRARAAAGGGPKALQNELNTARSRIEQLEAELARRGLASPATSDSAQPADSKTNPSTPRPKRALRRADSSASRSHPKRESKRSARKARRARARTDRENGT